MFSLTKKIGAPSEELIYHQCEDDETAEEQIQLSKEPIPAEEEAYYEKCKQYYHITQMPVISVSDDLFSNDIESTSASLVSVIDKDYNDFDVKIFLNYISNILNISDISINKIQTGCVKVIFNIFKGVASAVRKVKIKAVYDSITDTVLQALGKLKVLFMFMGDIKALSEKQKLRNDIKLYPEWNRIYDISHLYWMGALNDGRDRGNQPYYCPIGWQRYSFHLTDRFYEKFKGWCVCYHGTKFAYGLSILLSGLTPAKAADHGAGIYATPSITYAAHPRYSEVREIESTHEKSFFKGGRYVQFLLQCRVHPDNIKKIGRETLAVDNKAIIDPNISNDAIEWLIDAKDKQLMDFNDSNSTIVCTGLMVRVTDRHPGLLSESQWWFSSHLCRKKENQHCLLGIDLDDLEKQKRNGDQCNILYE